MMYQAWPCQCFPSPHPHPPPHHPCLAHKHCFCPGTQQVPSCLMALPSDFYAAAPSLIIHAPAQTSPSLAIVCITLSPWSLCSTLTILFLPETFHYWGLSHLLMYVVTVWYLLLSPHLPLLPHTSCTRMEGS